MRRRLIVFGRVPQPGRVKTRLAASIGANAAADAYAAMLAHALRIGDEATVDERLLCLADFGESAGEAARLVGPGWRLALQRGSGLGERMLHAIDGALDAGSLPVLIGSDCPSMEPHDIDSAFSALAREDAVFSPTEDGGYALVGMRRSLATAFDGVPWSGPRVMTVTRERLRACGATWVELRTLWDVDEEAGLRRWLSGRTPGPASTE